MPDEQPKTDPKKEEPTDTDVKKTLDGVLGWVQKQKVKAEEKVTKNPKSKPWGWVLGLIMAVLVFVTLAIAAWQAWKKGKEVAKLKHKIDVNKEKEEQAKANALIAENEEERQTLEKEAEKIRGRIEDSEKKIEKLKEERDRKIIEINEVTDWDGLDNLIK
jgi:uncharacterized protein HemX